MQILLIAGIGVAIENIAFGVGIGLFLGVVMMMIFIARNKKKSG